MTEQLRPLDAILDDLSSCAEIDVEDRADLMEVQQALQEVADNKLLADWLRTDAGRALYRLRHGTEQEIARFTAAL